MSNPVIICAVLTGAATFKQNNSSVPYTIEEFTVEAEKCFQAGAAMVNLGRLSIVDIKYFALRVVFPIIIVRTFQPDNMVRGAIYLRPA